MEVVSKPDVQDWRFEFTCSRCEARCVASAEDLGADEFKVAGFNFAGSAVYQRAMFVHCGVCDAMVFLDPDTAAGVPWELAESAPTNPRHGRPAPITVPTGSSAPASAPATAVTGPTDGGAGR